MHLKQRFVHITYLTPTQKIHCSQQQHAMAQRMSETWNLSWLESMFIFQIPNELFKVRIPFQFHPHKKKKCFFTIFLNQISDPPHFERCNGHSQNNGSDRFTSVRFTSLLQRAGEKLARE